MVGYIPVNPGSLTQAINARRQGAELDIVCFQLFDDHGVCTDPMLYNKALGYFNIIVCHYDHSNFGDADTDCSSDYTNGITDDIEIIGDLIIEIQPIYDYNDAARILNFLRITLSIPCLDVITC